VIALILGAGLKALKLSSQMVRPAKADKSFPGSLLAKITEEEEPENNNEIVKVVPEDLVANALEDDDVDPVNAERELGVPGW
jgi:hypothetical protein